MIDAKIIKDSVAPNGTRITTFVLEYPRFIHSELMTHRMFSRNSASSRAIPNTKMLEQVRTNPAKPVYWGSNKPGMQAGEEVANPKVSQNMWERAAHAAAKSSEQLSKEGLHKQICNRLLEPFFWMKVLVTATDWDNFFVLRANAAAQPEFQVLAYKMLKEYLANKDKVDQVEWGGWHIPFAAPELSLEENKKVAVARCARTSYNNFDGTSDIKKDLDLFEKLSTSGHWSPFEHIASAFYGRYGNFHDWRSYRFDLEQAQDINLQDIMKECPEWVKKHL
jgi:thymidylate synthase ThyX